ncbi:hypothetical protein CAI21_20530 [Alkalilimnicola ehrlichii]|uniref:DUF4382 domain-containing protein n=1 Tax=Alkalilimnicola ehrlichii TaxID=351052 RepID=A0A3E0WSQ7_9GAMM|nr:DUF4382 domain-containing protein [Alkalilimnicola ehrlichii]RFA24739.1 hypothetical protein CAI21_20530 [Alkalilimnicola ehrlichii]RFA35429.1 hypothetical protein CAL65_13205 [Alkalilimnicola ehrlichii]
MTYRISRSIILPAAAFGMAALLSACDGDSNGSDTGTLSLAVTDAPVDSARAVYVDFTGVTLQPASGQRIEFDFEDARRIDLLELQGGVSKALLDGETVPAGAYSWMRLKLADTPGYIELDTGDTYPLWVPSGAQTGLKLQRGFTVPVNGHADFTIDFDLRKSVLNPGNGSDDYRLRPTLRLVDNTEVGAIAGEVFSERLTDDSCDPENAVNVVYIFDGRDVEPTDLGSEPGPLTTASVREDGTNSYHAAFLPAGEYTVAFTCRGELDDPEVAGDELSFQGVQAATVQAGETTTVDF